MDREEIFRKVLDCAFEVHTNLGPGLLESVYEECLFMELQMAGLNVEKQKHLTPFYKGVKPFTNRSFGGKYYYCRIESS